MTRGRKPKPREVQIAEGRHLKNPQRFKDEPPPTSPDEPAMPSHFEGLEVDAWQSIEQVLRAAGLWSATYQVTLELYCETYANYREAVANVKKFRQASAFKDKDGNLQTRRNAYSVELHKYKDEVLKLLTEMGLTPSSRARVAMGKEKNGDDDFLSLLA
jgi:P27 family predicted phage terminase small subunit